MFANLPKELMQLEEAHKEGVYHSLEKDCRKAYSDEMYAKEYMVSGAFDDVDEFLPRSSFAYAASQREKADELYKSLYSKPYISHIVVKHIKDGEAENIYLSDSETLDDPLDIVDGNIQGTLYPFARTINRPISKILWDWHMGIDVKERNYYLHKIQVVSPELICRVEICSRELISVVQQYPEILSFTDTDELLERLLDENRDSPSFRNIIASLQREQFKIIEMDPLTSFIVQGCAGSGKSQCLLHRLFFLRNELSRVGWENVLLLTPTQLFKNYSFDLIRRYGLSGIQNCSISELYQFLLSSHYPHSKKHQYYFKLSEEYLPDSYLQAVYNKDTVRIVQKRIADTLQEYVHAGCAVLGKDKVGVVNYDTIAKLVKQIDKHLNTYRTLNKRLLKDTEYAERKKKYNTFQKRVTARQIELKKLENELEMAKNAERQNNGIKHGKKEIVSKQIIEIKKVMERNHVVLHERTVWLKEREISILGVDDAAIYRQLDSLEIEHIYKLLSDAVNSIFEQVSLEAILPLKKQYKVPLYFDGVTKNKHQRKVKVLYKSDMLFYLMVYLQLYPNLTLPSISLICIDEGQDLYKVDYDMLHTLFPRAAFNIFGDTAQILHESHSINSWESETGISTLYTLNCNYRNTAAIVEFCNTMFGSHMTAIGKPCHKQSPIIVSDIASLRKQVLHNDEVVVIVKNRQCYEQLCNDIGVAFDTFEFLDTTADKTLGKKVTCYSVFAAKGLEFSNVVVYSKHMSRNQNVVACTRAMKNLYYYL